MEITDKKFKMTMINVLRKIDRWKKWKILEFQSRIIRKELSCLEVQTQYSNWSLDIVEYVTSKCKNWLMDGIQIEMKREKKNGKNKNRMQKNEKITYS